MLQTSAHDRFFTIAGWTALSLGLTITLTTLVLVVVTYNPVPCWDQWDNLVAGHAVDWGWLSAQHNEHRIVFPRLIFVLDHALARETNIVDLMVNIVLVGATFAMLVHVSRRSGLLAPRSRALWTLGLLSGFLFSAIQRENFTWGFQVQFFGVCTLAVACVSVMVLARPNTVSLCAVIVFEAVALYTLSSGIVIVILAIALAVWLKWPPRTIALLIVAGAALIASYLAGYRTPVANTDPLQSIAHLPSIILYALTEIGSPIYSVSFLRAPIASAALGAIGVFAAGRYGLDLWRRRTLAPLEETVWLALATFAVGVAILTAMGRSGFGIEQALASRYATPMILLWLALSILAAMEAGRSASLRKIRTVTGMGLVLLALFGINQPRLVEGAMRNDAYRRAAVPAVLAGVADKDVLVHLYPTVDGIMTRVAALKQDHASVFAAPWADWLGKPLPNADGSGVMPDCGGSVASVLLVDDPSHPGWRAVGRLDGDATPNLSNRLIFLGDDRRVIGYGLAGFSAKAVGQKPGEAKDGDWWLGDFTAADPTAVSAYALTTDDRLGCRVGPLTPAR